jgi:hypothetical protein
MISILKYKFLFSAFLMSSFLKADLYDLYYDKEASSLRILPIEVQCLIAEKFLEAQPFPLFKVVCTIYLEKFKERLFIATFAKDNTILAGEASLLNQLYKLKRDNKQYKAEELSGCDKEFQEMAEEGNKRVIVSGAKVHDLGEQGLQYKVFIKVPNGGIGRCVKSCSHPSNHLVLSRLILSDGPFRPIILEKVCSSVKSKWSINPSIWNAYELVLNKDLAQEYIMAALNLGDRDAFIQLLSKECAQEYLVATINLEENNCLYIWKHNGYNHWTIKGILKHPQKIYTAQFNERKDIIVTTCADGNIRVWNLKASLADYMPQKRITLEQLLFLRLINVIHNRGGEVKLEEIAQKLHGPLSLNLSEELSVENYLFSILESFGDEVRQELINRYNIATAAIRMD